MQWLQRQPQEQLLLLLPQLLLHLQMRMGEGGKRKHPQEDALLHLESLGAQLSRPRTQTQYLHS